MLYEFKLDHKEGKRDDIRHMIYLLEARAFFLFHIYIER